MANLAVVPPRPEPATPAYPANVLATARVFLTVPGATPEYVRSYSDLPAFGQVASAMEAMASP
jgi:hypothetical protein